MEADEFQLTRSRNSEAAESILTYKAKLLISNTYTTAITLPSPFYIKFIS